jgi:hypothetical protein
MSKTLTTSALAICLGGFALSASGQTIISDNFEYANQAAYEAVWAPIGTVAPLSAELSLAQASSGTHSIRLPGTTVSSTSRNRRTFADTTVTTSTKITSSFDFYDSAPDGSPARNYCNLQDTTAPSGTGQLIGMGFNNNQSGTASGGQYYMARILGYAPTTVDPDGGANEGTTTAGAYFKLNDFGVGLRTLGWHNLKVVISTDGGNASDFEFYVDNQLAERVSNVGTVLRGYDNIALGSGLSNASTEAFIDNMVLEVSPIPEPSSATFGLLGLGLFLWRKLRK